MLDLSNEFHWLQEDTTLLDDILKGMKNPPVDGLNDAFSSLINRLKVRVIKHNYDIFVEFIEDLPENYRESLSRMLKGKVKSGK